jgi:hypothetical protein
MYGVCGERPAARPFDAPWWSRSLPSDFRGTAVELAGEIDKDLSKMEFEVEQVCVLPSQRAIWVDNRAIRGSCRGPRARCDDRTIVIGRVISIEAVDVS